MNAVMHMELSLKEAEGILGALRDKCAGLGTEGNREARELLEGVRTNLAKDKRTGEKLQLDLEGVVVDWLLIAVREKRLKLSREGKEKAAEVLQGILSSIVLARDAT